MVPFIEGQLRVLYKLGKVLLTHTFLEEYIEYEETSLPCRPAGQSRKVLNIL